jgi:hypothetical protein
MSFADITALDTVASGVESALADGSLANCLDSVAAANGIDLEVQPSPLAAPAPRQGGGRAFLLAAGDNPGAERMVEHIYWWKEGTTLSTLVVSTWGSETDVRAIVAAASGASR